jgi:hypothetical protein
MRKLAWGAQRPVSALSESVAFPWIIAGEVTLAFPCQPCIAGFQRISAHSQRLIEENETMHKLSLAVLNRWKFKGWNVCGTVLISFAAGSLVPVHLTHLAEVRADSNRVFQLEIYHTVPGKVPALESRFRDASKLQAKHNLNVVGYWIPNDDPAFANTFIYLVAHSNREVGEKNWAAFHADPAFQEFRKSEDADKLIENVDETYMRPTDYSPMK